MKSTIRTLDVRISRTSTARRIKTHARFLKYINRDNTISLYGLLNNYDTLIVVPYLLPLTRTHRGSKPFMCIPLLLGMHDVIVVHSVLYQHMTLVIHLLYNLIQL